MTSSSSGGIRRVDPKFIRVLLISSLYSLLIVSSSDYEVSVVFHPYVDDFLLYLANNFNYFNVFLVRVLVIFFTLTVKI